MVLVTVVGTVAVLLLVSVNSSVHVPGEFGTIVKFVPDAGETVSALVQLFRLTLNAPEYPVSET